MRSILATRPDHQLAHLQERSVVFDAVFFLFPKLKKVMREREKARSSFAHVNAGVEFTPFLSTVCKRQYTTSLCQWHPSFSVQSD